MKIKSLNTKLVLHTAPFKCEYISFYNFVLLREQLAIRREPSLCKTKMCKK